MPVDFIDFLPVSGAAPLLSLMAIYALAGLISGFSGFGFSGVGSLSMIALPPQLAIPLLMAISLVTQAASTGSLWRELHAANGAASSRERVLPYLLGGLIGMPVGLEILARTNPASLKGAVGLLLVVYAAWSLLVPARRQVATYVAGTRSALLVGAAGGVVGGIAAFPGSALVIWNGIVGRNKTQSRALVQPFILVMQVVGLGLLWATHRTVFGADFFAVFLFALPVALIGNSIGVAIYRRTGDLGYRRVTLLSLGVAGVGLLVKVFV